MIVELINKELALLRSDFLKEIAWSIAQSYNTTPANCEEKTCRQFMDYLSVTSLKQNEVCVFIDGLAARQLTNFKITDNTYVLGNICGKEIDAAYIDQEELHIRYTDGVIEHYKYHDQAQAWYFDRSNSKIKLPQTSIN